ncbi:hypothetical protein JR316_0011078 [Psilocybe cubensis]|uniref:Uncharacterized protein n=1 Tax=Psilocybe cubensis TaxID=181762 RepID=A0ACB8GPL8_PSICU|nr:hypothetical protein JR316_0011078 [Psilocybe cubensis]KAH9477161.1 hypothetical protein JR316_0011078 [Psilocybe cubensis]
MFWRHPQLVYFTYSVNTEYSQALTVVRDLLAITRIYRCGRFSEMTGGRGGLADLCSSFTIALWTTSYLWAKAPPSERDEFTPRKIRFGDVQAVTLLNGGKLGLLGYIKFSPRSPSKPLLKKFISSGMRDTYLVCSRTLHVWRGLWLFDIDGSDENLAKLKPSGLLTDIQNNAGITYMYRVSNCNDRPTTFTSPIASVTTSARPIRTFNKVGLEPRAIQSDRRKWACSACCRTTGNRRLSEELFRSDNVRLPAGRIRLSSSVRMQINVRNNSRSFARDRQYDLCSTVVGARASAYGGGW